MAAYFHSLQHRLSIPPIPPFPPNLLPNDSPLTLSLSPSSPLFLPPSSSSLTNSLQLRHLHLNQRNREKLQTRRRRGICRVELSGDAPFAIAIGACVLSSLVFAVAGDTPSDEEEEGDAVLGPTDARITVMSVISLIPYFNWLGWVFAWMDTGKRRYAVYAIVYLAPYLRSNLSLSPDESWLPIASIALCIIHVQLEASIQNGDLEGLAFFSEIFKLFSPATKRKHRHGRIPDEGRKHDDVQLPSAQERLRDEIRRFGMPQKPFRDPEITSKDADEDEEEKH